MKRILKVICIFLAITLAFSSCSLDGNKILKEINEYIANDDYNGCYEYVMGLDQDKKEKINDEVCNTIITKFIELKDKTDVSFENIYDLSTYDTSFAEVCQKLWNIISQFTVEKEDSYYQSCVFLRYFAEMVDYTRYDEIYSLIKKVYNTNYLNKLSTALSEYEINGKNTPLLSIYEEIKAINLDSYDPQQFLVEDYKNAHEKLINSLYKLKNAFSINDPSSVATSINDLKNALTDILYITDTLSAVNSMQKNIYNKLSTENIFNRFDSEIQVKKREFNSGMSFSLNTVYGDYNNSSDTNNDVSTTNPETAKATKEEVLSIAVNAINKTKKYKGNVTAVLTQTRDITLSDFKSSTNIKDAEELEKSQLSQAIEQSNGTGKTTYKFSNGTDRNQTLNSFVPPSNKSAVSNADAITDYSILKGSGGYVITLKLDREFVKTGQPSLIINSLVNTFEFENSSGVKKFESSYAETVIELIVNNNGMLAEYRYTLDGVSNCDFGEQNSDDIYKAQFTFKNEYLYKFSY